MYLFANSQSRADNLIITIIIIMLINRKYKFAAILFVAAGIVTALIKAYLGI